MSVKSHRTEGDSLILTLRSGGEIVCDSSVIVRIAPDEVPYPEPEVATPPANPVAAVAAVAVPAQDVVPYGAIIDKVAAEQGVNAKLVRAVIQVESGYQERARSPKGAMGLMQLMPATARHYAVTDPYDPLPTSKRAASISRRSSSGSRWRSRSRPTTRARRPWSGSEAFRRIARPATTSPASSTSSAGSPHVCHDRRASFSDLRTV